MVSLRDAFDQHVIVTEKPGGLYEEIMERAPRLAGKLRRLQDEHPTITQQIGAVLATARDRRDRRRRARRGRWIGRATTSSGCSAASSATGRPAPTSSGRRTTSTSADRSSVAGRARLPVVVRIALGQLNITVGDLDGNVARMADVDQRARPRPAPT